MKNSAKLFSAIDALTLPIALDALSETVAVATGIEEEMLGIAQFTDNYYSRCLIHKGQGYEALLLTWKPRQRTPLHNHKGSACVVRVLKGAATEVSYSPSDSGLLYPFSTRCFSEGEIVSSFDDDIHQLSNLSNGELVTLHIYSPALREMEIFSLSGTVLESYDELIYRSYTTKTTIQEIYP